MNRSDIVSTESSEHRFRGCRRSNYSLTTNSSDLISPTNLTCSRDGVVYNSSYDFDDLTENRRRKDGSCRSGKEEDGSCRSGKEEGYSDEYDNNKDGDADDGYSNDDYKHCKEYDNRNVDFECDDNDSNDDTVKSSVSSVTSTIDLNRKCNGSHLSDGNEKAIRTNYMRLLPCNYQEDGITEVRSYDKWNDYCNEPLGQQDDEQKNNQNYGYRFVSCANSIQEVKSDEKGYLRGERTKRESSSSDVEGNGTNNDCATPKMDQQNNYNDSSSHRTPFNTNTITSQQIIGSAVNPDKYTRSTISNVGNRLDFSDGQNCWKFQSNLSMNLVTEHHVHDHSKCRPIETYSDPHCDISNVHGDRSHRNITRDEEDHDSKKISKFPIMKRKSLSENSDNSTKIDTTENYEANVHRSIKAAFGNLSAIDTQIGRNVKPRFTYELEQVNNTHDKVKSQGRSSPVKEVKTSSDRNYDKLQTNDDCKVCCSHPKFEKSICIIDISDDDIDDKSIKEYDKGSDIGSINPKNHDSDCINIGSNNKSSVLDHRYQNNRITIRSNKNEFDDNFLNDHKLAKNPAQDLRFSTTEKALSRMEEEHRMAAIAYRLSAEHSNNNQDRDDDNTINHTDQDGDIFRINDPFSRSTIHDDNTSTTSSSIPAVFDVVNPKTTIDLTESDDAEDRDIENKLHAASTDKDPEDYSIKGLLEHVAFGKNPNVEMDPPSPPFLTKLYHFQKQALSFLYSVEKSSDLVSDNDSCHVGKETYTLNSNDSRKDKKSVGGWLAFEAGMGSTTVILSLICSNPPSALDDIVFSSSQVCNFFSHLAEKSRNRSKMHKEVREKKKLINVKATVIITSNSLMGQWEDECKKCAPNLIMERYHPPSKAASTLDFTSLLYHQNENCAKRLAQADIIVTTGTFAWPEPITKHIMFHRVILDEAHLLGKSGSLTFKNAMIFQAKMRWCVTPVPITMSTMIDLEKQAGFLRLMKNKCFVQRFRAFQHALELKHKSDYVSWDSKRRNEDFYNFANTLQKFMIRQTHSQQICLRDSLILPASTLTTVFLNMCQEEEEYYHSRVKCPYMQADLYKYSTQALGCKMVNIQSVLQSLMYPFKNGIQPQKVDKLLRHLKNDLRQYHHLRFNGRNSNSNEPNAQGLKIVVFTNNKTMHSACFKAMRSLNKRMNIFQVDGSSNGANRYDEVLRRFQLPSLEPSAIICTWRQTTGSSVIGISLTSASKIYFMEPWIDQTSEKQAITRVCHLNKNHSNIPITKFVYNNSYEMNILKLHDAMACSEGIIKIGNYQGGCDQLPMQAASVLTDGILPANTTVTIQN